MKSQTLPPFWMISENCVSVAKHKKRKRKVAMIQDYSAVGGLIGGKVTRQKHPTIFSELGKLSCHIKWHAKKLTMNPQCKYCTAGITEGSTMKWSEEVFEESQTRKEK